MKQTVILENLSCQNCVKHVTERFLNLVGVSEVTVNLEKQTAVVTTSQAYEAADFQAALDKTIYKVVEVSD